MKLSEKNYKFIILHFLYIKKICYHKKQKKKKFFLIRLIYERDILASDQNEFKTKHFLFFLKREVSV